MTRWLFLGAIVLGASAALADPGFIPSPVPPAPAPAETAPAREAVARDIDRAERGVRQGLEERALERKGSRAEVEAYRARELRALDVDRIGAPPDARSDVDRARERLELERSVDRIERSSTGRAGPRGAR